MSELTMYMVTHKNVNFIPDGRVPFFVGSAENVKHYLADNTKDNISYKNDSYCELTALYWIWKNDASSKYVSIEHYRRFFMKKTSIIPAIVKPSFIENSLKEGKIIVSRSFKFGISIEEYYRQRHYEEDLLAVKKAIEKLYPTYLGTFKNTMQGYETYLFNMLAMKKEDFNNYCEWLFSILFEAEKEISLDGRNQYQRRVYGFLAERLLMVWIRHNKCEVEKMPIYSYEENIVKTIIKSAYGRIPTVFTPKTPRR